MLKAIIIDDEPHAIDLLQGYIEKVSFLTCIKSFRNPIEALVYLQDHSCDVLFLDINMPQLSGMALLKTLQNPPKVILTTAYSEYAVESYELNTVDYLLKPISFDRFLKAALKLEQPKEESTPKQSPSIFVKSGYQQHKVALDELLYLEKDGNYISYITKKGAILARQSVQEALDTVGQRFIQVHKSIIVNEDLITSYDSTHVYIDHKKLPMGKSFKRLVLDRIKT